MEEWRDIEGYEGRYQVSSLGNVRTKDFTDRRGVFHKGRMLNKTKQNSGYYQVHILRKNVLVHRLVAMAFVEGQRDGLVVNHKNECKTDNRATNLEWVTHRENNLYNGLHERISLLRRRLIERVEDGKIFRGLYELADNLGVYPFAIKYSINNGTRCKGYHWRYIDK